MTAYKTYTENQLFSPEISTTTGYSKLYVNAGKVTNKGIELALGFKQNIGPVDWKTTYYGRSTETALTNYSLNIQMKSWE